MSVFEALGGEVVNQGAVDAQFDAIATGFIIDSLADTVDGLGPEDASVTPFGKFVDDNEALNDGPQTPALASRTHRSGNSGEEDEDPVDGTITGA